MISLAGTALAKNITYALGPALGLVAAAMWTVIAANVELIVQID